MGEGLSEPREIVRHDEEGSIYVLNIDWGEVLIFFLCMYVVCIGE